MLPPNSHPFNDFDPTRLALTHLVSNDQKELMLPLPMPCFPGLSLCSLSFIFKISYPKLHLSYFIFGNV